ncbi:cytochrome P450 [Pseudoruegeria sp. HB172150]|uniref:cytochrome P450 n=1 Tax=Pseudoruegeria sp. HB172150 TaxID=2721164 RepID=UPI001554007A|nr:cytochrome P450 [Pseudoruegeria sp. HB172150]
MKLGPRWHSRIERQGSSFVPPYPHRRTDPANTFELVRLYRNSLISVFSKRDYKRDVISTRFGLLDVHTVNTVDLVKEALHVHHETLQAKTPQMRHALKPLLGDGLFVSDRETWASRRAVVSPIIHASRVKDFAPIMLDVVAEWRDSWLALGDGAEVDVLAEMAELTAEIISRTVFGRRLGREFTAEIVRGFSQYQAHVDQLDVLSLIRAPDWIPRFQSRAARRALRRVHRVIDDIIEEFAQGRGDETAVIAQLFSSRDAEGNKLTREAIRNEAIVIFMAGHETTANTLAWAWYLLSQSERVRTKFHTEIDALGHLPGFADVRELIYTRSIIEETLRLYPPVPILGRQALDDTQIGDTFIRKGSVVMICPFMLHRKRSIYSRPDYFIPERFDERIAKRPEKYAHIPFAIGPRICPGLMFGLTEAIISLATLGQQFDIDLKPGHEVQPVCRLTLRPGATLPMLLRRRQAQRKAA